MQFLNYEQFGRELVKCDESHLEIKTEDILHDFKEFLPEMYAIYHSINQRFVTDNDELDIEKLIFFMHASLVQLYTVYKGKPRGYSTTFMCALIYGMYLGQSGLMRVEKGQPSDPGKLDEIIQENAKED